ncbi:hypothetical protein KFK14_12950 [Sphingobium phenoxybenzoativorans]|uniref:Uncharacterized protein n=1 Tax=Sphingobium phenoxybenzoativorans TaxID=1592790 RepID=A0A975K351_9SPHN|nr:hypothetical protein [Sphingobium phenoxybenzoativorans]QUT04055.1 hypothetical protein KFK14_12950 [Sphingobium phenoxybenzoativorans]
MSGTPNTYAFGGGLDVVSAALAVPPSRIVSGMNYEPLAEGYGRVQGFERFDGRTAPSAAVFGTLKFDSGVAPIAMGNLITGGTSGATAHVVLSPIGFEGSWDAGTARGSLIITAVTGTFVDNETLIVGGGTKALVNGPATFDSAPSEDIRAHYVEAAQTYYRELVGKVPGSGPVRGVAVYNGNVYAWRDNIIGSAGAMWKATALGWVEVHLGYQAQFTLGTNELVEGQTIFGATSGASATVARVVRRSGNWGTNAAGYVVLTNIVGVFTNEIAAGDGHSVTIAPVTSHVLPAGGRYMTIGHNFFGASNRYRMYGCNGVGRGFEFDGTVFAFIYTGSADDRPQRVFEAAEHLGFTFPGGSIQYSSITGPLDWDGNTGAGDLGFGTEITDVVQAAQTSVLFFGEKKIAYLTGTDSESFILNELTEEAGADAWTAQKIGKIMYLDKRGLRDVQATSAFGNFKAGSLSELIAPYFTAKRKAGRVPVASHVCRSKSQYRLYWSDRTGLCVFMGRKTPEAIPFSTDDMQVYCSGTGELADGEGMFVGAEDGYVYRIDSGSSFDGTGIKGFVMTPYNHIGAVGYEKRLHKIVVEMQAAPLTRLGITVMFNYSDGSQPNAGRKDFTVQGSGDGIDFRVTGGGGIWDTSDWNQFFWSAPYSGKAEAHPDGQGENMSCIFACDSLVAEPHHVLQTYSLHTSRRKLVR